MSAPRQFSYWLTNLFASLRPVHSPVCPKVVDSFSLSSCPVKSLQRSCCTDVRACTGTAIGAVQSTTYLVRNPLLQEKLRPHGITSSSRSKWFVLLCLCHACCVSVAICATASRSKGTQSNFSVCLQARVNASPRRNLGTEAYTAAMNQRTYLVFIGGRQTESWWKAKSLCMQLAAGGVHSSARGLTYLSTTAHNQEHYIANRSR